ncbi:Ycf48-like protein [Rubripirellula tenax]|uniref:Ycf48-like protein n=1 Tax=Rubripirellula tenax TaxID=2528015 RepID=A0A5C6F7U3_9BACT|nr:hypothetical protein [Rubripirellula tenax]TWU57042.1 Ycf48-like protein [Rubripirellula tenax]
MIAKTPQNPSRNVTTDSGGFCRFYGCFLISAALVIGNCRIVDAATPEPTPTYSQTRLLRPDAALRAVAFDGGSSGIAVGDRGSILFTTDGGASWTAAESNAECRLDDVVWIGQDRAIAVGGHYDAITRISRGVVLVTDDRGATWRRSLNNDLPRLRHIEIQEDRALSVSGDWSHPSLTRRFESRNGGRDWNATGSEFADLPVAPELNSSDQWLAWVRATTVHAPIRDACRFGDHAVCAVGDHGVILTSDDDGKNWTIRHGQGRRPAVLLVAADARSVPWALLGSESLESRHRTSLLLDVSDAKLSDPANDFTEIDLAGQAAVMLGGAGADRFATDADDRFQSAMKWIAIHRPSAVVLDQTLAPETRDAFFEAATAAGVDRVAVYSTGQSMSTTLHRDALLPKSGVLASDLASDALQLVSPQRTVTESISIRFLYDASPSRKTGESVASGLRLHPGQRITDRDSPASRRQLQIVQARMKQSKRIEQLLARSRSDDSLAKTLAMALDQTAKEDQFRFAWAVLSETSTDASEIVEAHKTVLREIATRFPHRSAGQWARLRLESLNLSQEWKRLSSTMLATQALTLNASTQKSQSVAVSPFQSLPDPTFTAENSIVDAASIGASSLGQVRQVSATTPVFVPQPSQIDYAPNPVKSSIGEVDLAWEFHPAVLLGVEAARRRGDEAPLQATDDQPASMRLLADSNGSSWSPLLRQRGPQVITAFRTATPPHLDGILDDTCWRQGDASRHSSVSVRMSYDDDYVYFAVECPSDALRDDTRDGTRDGGTSTSRDHDLTGSDRVRICIDTDKDLFTSMQLQSTLTRRTHDSIDGNPAWQPTWYLDVARQDERTTMEIAIQRRDIVDLPIATDSPFGENSWFVSAKILAAMSVAKDELIPVPTDWIRVVFR